MRRRCACGRGINGSLAVMCSRCGQLGRTAGTVPPSVVLDGPALMVQCPHCTALPTHRTLTCCECAGARQVTLDRALHIMQSVWARPGCVCQTCAVFARTVSEW